MIRSWLWRRRMLLSRRFRPRIFGKTLMVRTLWWTWYRRLSRPSGCPRPWRPAPLPISFRPISRCGLPEGWWPTWTMKNLPRIWIWMMKNWALIRSGWLSTISRGILSGPSWKSHKCTIPSITGPNLRFWAKRRLWIIIWTGTNGRGLSLWKLPRP